MRRRRSSSSGRRDTRSCSSAGSGWPSSGQQELGIAVPDGVIEAYEAAIDNVDLDSIEQRERVTRHDVKARIEEFAALAGSEHIHKGMTSRDLTENVEQLQVKASLELVRIRVVAALARLAALATEHAELVMVGRSHNVPAQATTLGKRFATAGEELLVALDRLDDLIERYPLRGIKGPMGTSQDQLDLLDGDTTKLAGLEEAVATSRVRSRAGLGWPGVSEIARSRCRRHACAVCSGAVLAGDIDPLDGRQRTRH